MIQYNTFVYETSWGVFLEFITALCKNNIDPSTHGVFRILGLS